MQTIKQLTALLDEVASGMEVTGENEFKIRAYRNAISKLLELKSEDELKNVAKGAVKVPGIGDGIRAAITEFLETGDIAQRKELLSKIPPGFKEIASIPGLGPKKAFKICSELGVQSIAELEYACRENRLVSLKGFGQSMQNKVLEGIEKMKNNLGKFRIDEAWVVATEIKNEIQKKFKNIKIEFSGALARYSEILELIEFYVELNDAKEISNFKKELAKKGEVSAEDVEVQSQKFLKLSVQADKPVIVWILKDKKINPLTRLTLETDAAFKAKVGEESFSKYLDWSPAWRESYWVEAKRKPAKSTYQKETSGSVKGFFHCHTNYSDGVNTLEEMVKAAQDKGYQYIGISDHSQSAFYAQGLKEDKILEQAELIQKLQKKFSIRIFHGVESDILADGCLDYSDDVLDKLDFIIGSIHSRFKMDEGAMTERLCKALSNPRITFWGHPTGRLLLGRKEYPLDWAKCLNAAQKNNVIIELNANPHRLDIDWRLGGELEKRNLLVSINPDAHEVEGIDDTMYGEMMAEKAMLSTNQIFNLKTVNEVETYLHARKI